MTKQLKISTRDYTSGRSGGTRKMLKNSKKKFGYGADYVSEEKINSPTVRKVS